LDGVPRDSNATIIHFRQFSPAPSIGRGQGAADPSDPDFGALRIFVDEVARRTAALGPGRQVIFEVESGAAAFEGVSSGDNPAAYMSGGSLNPVWGFVYNSIPFGPTFETMVGFLYDGGGLDVLDRIYTEREIDVVALPVVGSPGQMSGYFKKPVGIPACDSSDTECLSYGDGIGLSAFCGEPWTLRYLPPAETVLEGACDRLSQPRRLGFVQAIPGGSAILPAVQQGSLDGLEFATVIDDYDARWGGLFGSAGEIEGSDGRNAAEVGLRFAHYPSWHQPYFIGWMVVDRSEAWNSLADDQRAVIAEAARASLTASFQASSSLLCPYLQRILDVNDGRRQRGPLSADSPNLPSADVVLTRWQPADLRLLAEATIELLEGQRGAHVASPDEMDYRMVIDALMAYLGVSSSRNMIEQWVEPAFPLQRGCTR